MNFPIPSFSDLVELTKAIVSWPAITIGIIVLFRDQINKLLDRISNVEILGMKAKFGEKLELATEASESDAKIPGATPPRNPSPIERVETEWEQLRESIRNLAEYHNIPYGIDITSVVQSLENNNFINHGSTTFIKRLTSLYSSAISIPNTEFSLSMAVAFVDLCHKFKQRVNKN